MGPSRREFLQQSFIVAGALNQVQDKFEPSYLRLEREKKLKALDAELWELFKSCSCCPRACGANRLKGEKGICNSTWRLKVHSAAPHFGEERSLVGQGGSGTIFPGDQPSDHPGGMAAGARLGQGCGAEEYRPITAGGGCKVASVPADAGPGFR